MEQIAVWMFLDCEVYATDCGVYVTGCGVDSIGCEVFFRL